MAPNPIAVFSLLSLTLPLWATTATASRVPASVPTQPSTLSPTLAPTLVSLEASPIPDENGVYSFEAEAGEILSITAQTNPDNPQSCYPEQISGTQTTPFGNFITQTPYSQSLLVQVVESGRFQYQIFLVPDFSNLLTSDHSTIANGPEPYRGPVVETEADAAAISGESWCRITVQLASPTEQLWATANQLYDQREDLDQALELYRQVVETQPAYPEPYRQYLELLIGLNFADLPTDVGSDPDAIGQWLVTRPDTVRQPIVKTLEQLADIYETNPTWQVDEHDHPTFLRDYATYIQTGVASQTVRSVLFMGF